MQLPCCNCWYGSPYDSAMRKRFSPGWTMYVFTQVAGGLHGSITTVGTNGTYNTEPACSSTDVRQLPFFSASSDVLYLWARE